MNGAQAMVKCLEEEGVKVVFGYPGAAICPFFHSLSQSRIESILVRTEQNAGHGANGYARVTHEAGVCVATSGPGATNLLTGIATAFADSIPLICITGQVESHLLGSDVFQEADITGAAESFVKYSYLVKNVEDIPRVFKEAFYLATTGRKGPVLIDIPMDVQNASMTGSWDYPKEVNLRTYKPTVKGNLVQIKKVAKGLEEAKRPILCAGGGILLSQAKEEVIAFAEKYQVPVVSTMMGIGVLPTEHELYFGMVGNNGKGYANRAMRESDFILMVGARVADRAISQPELIANDKILVHIDVDPAEIGKNVGPAIPLVGDIKHILEDFEKQEITCEPREWIETLKKYRETMQPKRKVKESFVDPGEFLKILSEEMEEDAIYVADVGQNQIWSCDYHIVKKGKFLTSGGMGTMGYAIPAAMGAKKGEMNKQVVAVCGDGAFQMSMMELATMRQHHIPVKIIVLKNDYLGMVREYQHFTYEDHYTMVQIDGSPDLEKLSAAYNIPFVRIEDMKDIREKIKTFFQEDRLAMMECLVDPMELTK